MAGVLVFEGGRFGPDSYVHSIEGAARARGYTTLATSLRGDDEPDVQDVLDHLLGRQLEGLIVVLPRDHQQQHLELLPADLPVVSMEARRSAAPRWPSCSTPSPASDRTRCSSRPVW